MSRAHTAAEAIVASVIGLCLHRDQMQFYVRLSVTQFLSRVGTLTRNIDIAILSVCPSVRLFVRLFLRHVAVLS